MKTRTISSFLCAVILLAMLSACGGSSYRDDVTMDELTAAIDAALPNPEEMVEASSNYIAANMNMDVASYAGYCIKLNSMGVNVDEYGVFIGKDEEQTGEIKAAVEEYFQHRKDIWMPEYMPHEYPKLENAEVKVAGNYVIYAILSEELKADVFAAFDETLKK